MKDIDRYQADVMARLDKKKQELTAEKTEVKERLKAIDDQLADLEKHEAGVKKRFEALRDRKSVV